MQKLNGKKVEQNIQWLVDANCRLECRQQKRSGKEEFLRVRVVHRTFWLDLTTTEDPSIREQEQRPFLHATDWY